MEELSLYPIIHEQKVAWGDMDAFGHVNNTVYYRYIESARIAYLDQAHIFDYDVGPVVASNQCQYLKPVVYPDTLKVAARVEELRQSGFRMQYLIWSEAQQQIVARSDAIIVFVNYKTMQKAHIPSAVREKIIALENNIGHDLK